MSNIQYDEQGGIVSLENQLEGHCKSRKKEKKHYSFLERLMIKKSRRLNYLLDGDGKYKCRQERLPNVIRIGPTNRCTAQCFYCPREHIHEAGSGYMDFEMYEEIVTWAEKNKVKAISFALFGEPLLHPRFFEMLELAREKGMALRVSSNAIIMDKEKANKLLDMNLEAMEMSLDGYVSHEFREGKRVDKHERVKENIEYLLSEAKKRKSKTVFNVHFVDAGNVSKKNKKRFVKYWSEKLNGLEHITSFYYEPHNWAGTRADVGAKINWLDKLLKKFELKKPCVYIKGINIDWNGNVVICTNDPTKEAVIGNIKQAKLEDIYNGETRMKYLSAHETGNFRELNCRKCNVNSYWPLLFIKKRIVNYFSK
ncbi:hypothetical protein C0583_03705 [Candidatus Parcubacteria bacterium]|nr:MAG: hypothetical protein C0583_03705 [Candidatus Parcubacteria bacterium]